MALIRVPLDILVSVLALATTTIALTIGYNIVILRRRREGRPDGLVSISDPPNPKFDIVAVHGLGAHPEHTWKCRDRTVTSLVKTSNTFQTGRAHSDRDSRTHLLRDLLKPDFPEARITSFAYNSDWLINSPVKTAQQIALQLLEELKEARSNHLTIPIIFIGHSFGGIVVKEALCTIRDDFREIVDSTHAVIFLGTPHHGSPVSFVAATGAFLTTFLGSEPTLLLALRGQNEQLSDLEENFKVCMEDKEKRRQKTKIISFFETKPTLLLSWFSIGHIVNRDSAIGSATSMYPIDTDHSGLNKSLRYGQLYKTLQGDLVKLKSDMTAKPILNANQQYVLSRLKAVKGAAFDSKPDNNEEECCPETRTDILKQIDEWAKSAKGKQIFWLQGKAGTGKSTISRTVARKLDSSKHLGASFFFKRGEGERSNAAHLFTTIASHLVKRLPTMSAHVRNAIEADPELVDKIMKEHFDELILKPLEMVNRGLEPSQIVIIIDALDECNREEDVEKIVKILLDFKQMPHIYLKFFVTSRLEDYIRDGFAERSDIYDSMALHQVPTHVIEKDISTFIKFRLERFRNKPKAREDQELLAGWPEEKQIEILTKMAIPLFIFAAVSCRLIEDRHQIGSPKDRLEKILAYQTKDHISSLDATYLPALNQMLYGLKPGARGRALKEFREVVGAIALLASPLSVDSLAILLDKSKDAVRNRLYLLSSVLSIPSNPNDPVTLFHLSFRDFLVSSDTEPEFQIDEKEIHKKLVSRCFDLVSDLPKSDICSREKLETLQVKIDRGEIERCLPPERQYACLYWVKHLQWSGIELHDEGKVLEFLQNCLLHWFEALGRMGRIFEGINAISSLKSFASVRFPS